MRRLAFALPLLAVTSFAAPALADISPGPRPSPEGGKCKCSAPGVPTQGALSALMLGGGALALLVARKRRRA